MAPESEPTQNEAEEEHGTDLPGFNFEQDVLVIPLDFDVSTLSTKSKITLELLDEMEKVIRVATITKPAIIKVR